MKKKIMSLLSILTLIFTSFAWMIPVHASKHDKDSVMIPKNDIPLKLWYTSEAPKINENASHPDYDGLEDDGWQQWSLPIGNGYFGASIFGRTETERVQITEKTLSNTRTKIEGSDKDVSYGGLNNFSETYIDFGHTNSEVTDYVRYLDMKTAISGVEYTYGGVKYTREYFTSYPDKALVIRLDADTEGALSFTLRPTVPYEQSCMAVEGDGLGKTGEVTSSVSNGVGYIELSGKLEFYDVDFLGIYKVYTDGGTVTASTTQNTYEDNDGTTKTDTDGTIVVNGAKSAYIVVTLGTDYELSSEVFTTTNANKPTQTTTLDDTRVKVEADMSAIDDKISGKSFEEAYKLLRDAHVSDHSELFGRVTVDLGCDPTDFEIPTDQLLENYKKGNKSTYLELLIFQYGRYQLVASSRPGTLPANLQGVWNPYNTAPWGSGYWHNINVQMNYWPAFSTNLAETFEAYVAFNDAFMDRAESNATSNIKKYNPDMLDEDGGNGWVIGVGSHVFSVSSDRSAGNLGFTTQMFWEYYQYTQDETILREIVLPKLLSAARYITKCVELDENGNYLVSYCDSPEVHVNGEWYYTKGTTYAQTFAYLNNYHLLCLIEEAGMDITDEVLLSTEEYSVLKTVMEQIDKYDPINVGLSGQIKEFREEDYYGSVGDDPSHRHVSQLVGLYPGNVINSNTPAWIDAALVTLDGRGQNTTGGWVYSHKATLYARAKDGDGARERVDELLSRVTFPNLFTKLWDVYQIDASCGVTAGIAEMLLQSNAGYIEPLAAIPSSWSDGSYTGLCAEGNFEVSAVWANGTAKTFNILSKYGNRASVSYPSITGTTVVRASDGKKISFTTDAKDRISFDTEVGETYIISGFTAQEKIDAPTKLSIARVGMFGEFSLDWTDVDGAESYNVYVALENDATYTLIGNTKNTTFNYAHSQENENARTTFAVTAVTNGGAESKRTLAYSNPIDISASITDTRAYVLESGDVQMVINANSNSEIFRLYSKSKTDSAYTLVKESKTPVIPTVYDSSLQYAVSALSFYDGTESKLFEVTDFASYASDYNAKNVFEGNTFVQNSTSNTATPMSSYGYEKLTDGVKASSSIHTGRYSSGKATANSPNKVADAVIDLGADYFLDEITFYVYGSKFIPQIGTDFTLEVYSGGKWVPIVSTLKNVYADDYTEGEPSLSDYLISVDNGSDKYHLIFDLNGIRGSKVRFYSKAIFKDGDSSYNYVTFWEIECSGVLVEGVFEKSENVILAKPFVKESTAPSYATFTNLGDSGSNYSYAMMTDGKFGTGAGLGRYSSKKGGATYATLDLGGIYSLYEMKFYYFNKDFAQFGGTNYNVEVYYNGEWITVIDQLSHDDISKSYLDTSKHCVFLDLGGVKAEKIRLFVEARSSTAYVSFNEVECSGYCLSELSGERENVFAGKTFESTRDTVTATISGTYYTFPYENLTDGKNYVAGTAANGHTGRFSTKKGGIAEGVINLEDTYSLDEIRFYPFEKKLINMGTNFTLEVYSGGVWKSIFRNLSNDEISGYLDSSKTCYVFDLGGIKAEKVRFYSESVIDGDSKYNVTLHEIECFGYKIINRTYENTTGNAFDGAAISSSGATGASNANDGKLNTYATAKDSSGTFRIEFSFNSTKLYTLGIYEIIESSNLVNGVLTTASNNTKVEIYRDNVWLTLYTDLALNVNGYTELNLYGTECEKIRITFTNTEIFDGESSPRAAKIAEITCTPGKPNAVDRSPMIEAYDKLSNLGIDTEKFTEQMAIFRSYLTDYMLSEDKVAPYTAEMNAYYETAMQDVLSSITFTPKMSITLESQLVMNVYIPAESLNSFTLDGIEYDDFSELDSVTVDGNKYYRITVALPSAEAARDVNLTATVRSNGALATATFTLSVPKYATKVLNNTAASEVEKALVKDVVAYVRSAYNYFTDYNTEEEIMRVTALINEILKMGGDYDGAPTISGETTKDKSGLVTDVTLNLDYKPTIRFYVTDTNVEFKIGNTVLETVKDIDGNYVELDVYAYALAETITFGDGGSYHISDFLEKSHGEAYEELVTCFVKYVESANNYRKSVIG